MFSGVISDFQHPQMSALHTDSNAVHFSNVGVCLADILHKFFQVFIIVMMEFLGFDEVDLFSMGVVLDVVDVPDQSVQGVGVLRYTAVTTCRGLG
jgi:hypothetical protein